MLREITYCHVELIHTGGVGFAPRTQWRHHPQSPLFFFQILRNCHRLLEPQAFGSIPILLYVLVNA